MFLFFVVFFFFGSSGMQSDPIINKSNSILFRDVQCCSFGVSAELHAFFFFIVKTFFFQEVFFPCQLNIHLIDQMQNMSRVTKIMN